MVGGEYLRSRGGKARCCAGRKGCLSRSARFTSWPLEKTFIWTIAIRFHLRSAKRARWRNQQEGWRPSPSMNARQAPTDTGSQASEESASSVTGRVDSSIR